ncbi:membrane protein [Paractinoplanes abujensis]|uniref:Putative membrane protein n=1 Tax=Paractinoplanes abujensis TaxID=882441 RepID=A0A7W7CNL8_9ACTN|nr:anthrone oxygenase family protein [Actinoplanes abujensis]MBB4691609.1 putative membrane protein [Actinoplanes abujensis]GID16972.1 membrane protein [Actinoplanes abujensis]
MFALRVTALIAATMTTGLMAGVFGLYQHTVMAGLARTDDRTFIGAFQALDRAIINPWFMTGFAGALLFTAAAAILSPGREILPWVLAALVLYIVVFGITVAVNVPLNDALKAAGSPDSIADLAGVRAAFDEARWTAWNLVRTIATTAAFGCLCWALVVRGRLG